MPGCAGERRLANDPFKLATPEAENGYKAVRDHGHAEQSYLMEEFLSRASRVGAQRTREESPKRSLACPELLGSIVGELRKSMMSGRKAIP